MKTKVIVDMSRLADPVKTVGEGTYGGCLSSQFWRLRYPLVESDRTTCVSEEEKLRSSRCSRRRIEENGPKRV